MSSTKTPGRPPRDPSGSGRKVALYLSPDHIDRLDSLIDATKRPTRSAVVAALIDRVTGPQAEPVAPEKGTTGGCGHGRRRNVQTASGVGGMEECIDCGARLLRGKEIR